MTIRWRNSAKKELRKLPQSDIARVVSKVDDLANDPYPHGAVKLTGSDSTYRIRVGDYRVVYDVLTDQNVVDILRVRHRKDAYRV